MSGSWVSRCVAIIDTNGYGSKGSVACYVVKGDGEAALVDVGYSTSWSFILNGLRELGVKLGDVKYVFLTHFHLDHSGGSHTALQNMPNAQLMVHEAALRVLLDPSRLVDAALAAFGEDIAHYIGGLQPIQPERIEPVREESYELGDVGLEVLFTPGHAPGHISLYLANEDSVFTGDAVCVRHPALPFPLPPASPPFYDVDSALQSLEKIRSLKPAKLYTPHFGFREAESRLFEEEAAVITAWRDEVERLLDEGLGANAIAESLRKKLLAKHGIGFNGLDSYVGDILLNRLLKISVQGYMGLLMRRRR
ncbi:MAG: MBL fold metallo-hydrolase [Candidatus Caldarchaeum sp.]